MRAGWIEKRLGDVCTIARGGSPRPIQKFLTDAEDGVSWVKISDASASTKYIFVTAEKIKPAGVSRSRLVHDGDFLLSNSMSFGRPYIMRTTGCIHDGWLVLSSYQGALDQEFLYFVLGSQLVYRQFDRLAAGSTVRNLNIELASRVVIPIPPMQEQQRIVAILDEAFAGIAAAKANTEKSLQSARELFENHHQSVFSQRGPDWREMPLGELGAFRNGVNYTKQSKGNLVRVVGVKDFKNGFFVPMEALDSVQLDGRLNPIDALEENDILIVRSNGNPALIGRCLLAGPLEGEICHSGFTIRLRLSEAGLSPRYLCHFLKTPVVRRGLTDGGTGANIRSLNQQMLSSLVVPIPPMTEQASIVERLESLANNMTQLADVYLQKLAALDELKQSLLAKAFAGELS